MRNSCSRILFDHIGHYLICTSSQTKCSEGMSPADIIKQMEEKYTEQSRLHFVTSTDIALVLYYLFFYKSAGSSTSKCDQESSAGSKHS